MYFRKFKKLSVALFCLFFLANTRLSGQDVEAKISIIHPKVQISNTQIFKSLESSISQFINQRLWCADKLTSVEHIKMTLLIDITGYELNSND